MKKGLLLFFSVFVFLSRGAIAAEAMTWQTAISEAKKNNPDLAAAKANLKGSEADRTIAASSLWPQVSGDLQLGRSSRESVTGVSTRTDAYSYGVSGRQLIFDAFKTYYDVKTAAKNVDASFYSYLVTSSNVRLNLRSAFISLLRAKELLYLTERIAERRQQSQELIQLRYDAGREHKGSLLTSKANLTQARFEIEQARRNIVLAERRFLTQLGKSRYEPVEVTGSLDQSFSDRQKPDLENLAETIPLLQQLVVLKEAAKWGIQSSVADFFPQVYADASAGRSSSDWPPDQDEWSVGATVSVPIFEGGNRVASLAKSKASFAQAEADEKSGRNGVIFTLEQAWADFQNAIDNVGVQKQFLEAAEERKKIAEAEYSAGLITFNDWIIIEDNLVSAEKSYLNARAEALIAEATWKQAKGETLDEA